MENYRIWTWNRENLGMDQKKTRHGAKETGHGTEKWT